MRLNLQAVCLASVLVAAGSSAAVAQTKTIPFFSYIIVSVRGGTPEDMTSWRLRDDRSAFDPEALEVGAAEGPTAHA